MKGKLFVISAPSGAGKTTVIKRLMKDQPELVLSVSYTTRSPRPTEKDGVDYHFVSEPEFKRMAGNNQLLEWANVHNFLYGTPREPIEKWVSEGKKVILDIDVQGGMNVKNNFKSATLIFLLPPSHEELVRRLTIRGANKGDDLATRIRNADVELDKKDNYDFQVVNDDLDVAVSEVKKIINA